jgi:hypothetical protein
VARRPFELDITEAELAPAGPEGDLSKEALLKALSKRPTYRS